MQLLGVSLYMDLNFLLFLQKLDEQCGGVLRKISEYISDLGGGTLTVVLLLVIYWSINKKLGTRIMISFVLGGLINQTLKNALCINRPWIRNSLIEPTKKALIGATGYSFPSGHSQTGVDVYGNIAYFAGKKHKVICYVSLALVFLVPVSRLILGVHTPQDVLVGMFTGFLGFICWIKLEGWIEAKDGRDVKACLAGAVLILIHLLFVSLKGYELVTDVDGTLIVDPDIMIVDCYAIAGVAVAAMLGYLFERRFVKFEVDGTALFRIIRSVLGITVFLVLYKAVGKMNFLNQWVLAFVKMLIPCFISIGIWPWIANWYEGKFVKARQ